jgi:hypothetical protein
VLLQSADKNDLVGEFEPGTGRVEVRSKTANPELASQKRCGFFANAKDGYAFLYRDGGKLFFQVGEAKVELSDDVSVRCEDTDSQRTLTVHLGERTLFSYRYVPARNEFADRDPTAFVDNEDFDFFLFVRNVASDPERKALIGSYG